MSQRNVAWLVDRIKELQEKAMAPHSSTLAWKIPGAEEPGRLQSMGSWRVRNEWATSLSVFTFMHWRRKWQPTPVFLPGGSQGQGSLVSCRLWGCTESDTTEATAAAAAEMNNLLYKMRSVMIMLILQMRKLRQRKKWNMNYHTLINAKIKTHITSEHNDQPHYPDWLIFMALPIFPRAPGGRVLSQFEVNHPPPAFPRETTLHSWLGFRRQKLP